MKNKIILLLSLVPLFAFSQTEQERAKIASFSDKEANAKLMQELLQEDNARRIRITNYLKNNPDVQKVTHINGVTKELMDVLPNGEKIFARTDNAGAATTARATALYNGGSLGINIQGQGMIAGIWDNGSVRSTHQEFMVSGVTKAPSYDAAVYGDHATHVGGTIVAQGINSQVRGLAFNASLHSYKWDDDLTEMAAEAIDGLLVSNHSYGMGSLSSVWFYGAYDSRARQIDNICSNNPYYLPVFSAGNDRNSDEEPGLTQLSTKGGYDMIFGHGNAKNVITIAAVNQVNNYTGPASVNMSAFSSFGPSDDGRIKPDISMKGVNVRSTLVTSDTSIGLMSGTSMASPGVTGVILLLQQYYNQLYMNYMRAATVKGLILHTADEAGTSDGPDYEFGWGLINAEATTKVIRDKNLTNNRSVIEENILTNGGVFTKTINANGTQPLKVSISWTDRPFGGQNSSVVDPTTKYLVNDLDVKVTSADGTIYYPWKLQGMITPDLPATNTSTNDVDNFERVDIPLPSGIYTITVTHKGTLQGVSQPFSLIVSSDNLSTLGSMESSLNKNDDLLLYPNPTKDFIFVKNSKAKEKTFIVLDNSGRIVKKIKNFNNNISVSELIKGNYILIFSDSDGKQKSFNFIKD